MDFVLLFILAVLVYLLILFVLRLKLYKSRLKNKNYSNCCPLCGKPLDRYKSKIFDKYFNILTLSIFGFKRFYCKSCSWSGLLAKYTKRIKGYRE